MDDVECEINFWHLFCCFVCGRRSPAHLEWVSEWERAFNDLCLIVSLFFHFFFFGTSCLAHKESSSFKKCSLMMNAIHAGWYTVIWMIGFSWYGDHNEMSFTLRSLSLILSQRSKGYLNCIYWWHRVNDFFLHHSSEGLKLICCGKIWWIGHNHTSTRCCLTCDELSFVSQTLTSCLPLISTTR